MRRLIKFTTQLSFQILILGLIGFFGTYISDYLEHTKWFGDFKGRRGLEWGARHYWYIWIVSILVFIQIVRIIIWCIAFWDKQISENLS